MQENTFKIIKKDDLPLGGFAGIVETQMVMSGKVWPKMANRTDISHGLEDFIYLANGYFKPNDGVPLHPHEDVDIVSIILNGKVGHKGTLGDGTIIKGPGVQVQRAGTGMQHSEFAVTDEAARIIQVWFLPPQKGLKPDYQNFDLESGKITTVLGDENTFNSNMICQVGDLNSGEKLNFDEDVVVLLTDGSALVNGKEVYKDDLIEGKSFELSTSNGCHLVIIRKK